MRFNLNHLTLFSALLISSVAIYFSVAGLVAIFGAYAISIRVMAGSIEIGKLVAVAWLHRNWDIKVWWLTTGLIVMIVGVMFITSMGIFGYLSKSHVEQTSASQENIAQIDKIDSEIARNKSIILRSNSKIKQYEDNGSGVDSSLQTQIDKEQVRIASAYDRVKPVINVQLEIINDEEARIADRVVPYTNEITAIDRSLDNLQAALNNGQIKKAQGIAGTNPDGIYKKNTIRAIKEFRSKKETRRRELLAKVDSIKSAPNLAVDSARAEITAIRKTAQSEITESNKLINRLRGKLGQSKESDIERLITEQQNKIRAADTTLDTLIERKFKIEVQYRKLEAEVGPIKYIAEFIFTDEPDANTLERAVRWVIILIIFVFDPFAVLLLIAAQYSFKRDQVISEPNKRTPWEIYKDIVEEEPIHKITQSEEPEPVMPENISVPEHEITKAVEEVAPVQLKEELPPSNHKPISLVKVSDDYINYNGKVYRALALTQAFPELRLDFTKLVASSDEFTSNASNGDLLLKTDVVPTELFRYNGFAWDKIDKNLLNNSAYTREYIQVLIDKVGAGEYNPELLNGHEKQHIQQMLTDE